MIHERKLNIQYALFYKNISMRQFFVTVAKERVQKRYKSCIWLIRHKIRANVPFICNRGPRAWDNGRIAQLKYRVLPKWYPAVLWICLAFDSTQNSSTSRHIGLSRDVIRPKSVSAVQNIHNSSVASETLIF